MHVTAGQSSQSNAVDLYNSTTGAWSTAQLSVARYGLAATSVGNVALFAGGFLVGTLLCTGGGAKYGCVWMSACAGCITVS
jgi:hypothetical protein